MRKGGDLNLCCSPPTTP